jgi:hypothetical protein
VGRSKTPIPGIRLNVHLRPEIAAQLKLACADLAFGGVAYGEQTRIINEALRLYFERGPECTQPMLPPE